MADPVKPLDRLKPFQRIDNEQFIVSTAPDGLGVACGCHTPDEFANLEEEFKKFIDSRLPLPLLKSWTPFAISPRRRRPRPARRQWPRLPHWLRHRGCWVARSAASSRQFLALPPRWPRSHRSSTTWWTSSPSCFVASWSRSAGGSHFERSESSAVGARAPRRLEPAHSGSDQGGRGHRHAPASGIRWATIRPVAHVAELVGPGAARGTLRQHPVARRSPAKHRRCARRGARHRPGRMTIRGGRRRTVNGLQRPVCGRVRRYRHAGRRRSYDLGRVDLAIRGHVRVGVRTLGLRLQPDHAGRRPEDVFDDESAACNRHGDLGGGAVPRERPGRSEAVQGPGDTVHVLCLQARRLPVP